MVDNIPPEELEIELSGRQIEQLDAIDNTVYQTILTFLNKTEDEFPWDMHYIGEVADAIEGTLLDLGQRVHRPAIITEKRRNSAFGRISGTCTANTQKE